jgi:uncharacterized protein
MQRQLPEVVDFMKQVDKNSCFEGSLPLARFERLCEIVGSESGPVNIRIRFGKRAGVPCLDGSVSADLVLECQRCLQPLTRHIEGGFRFGLVTSEDDIASLPAEFEPFLVEAGEQSLLEVLEDELLLSLPIVAMHEEDCSVQIHDHDEHESTSGDTYRPFAGLKDMMN